MQKIALLAVVLLALTIASPIWAQGCHGGGSGCPMSGCPGSGQTMTDVSGRNNPNDTAAEGCGDES